jgi:phosphoribosylanthranilate isomerase
VPVDGPDAVELAAEYAAVADLLLLDTMGPSGNFGATGLVHDWAVSERIAREAPVPVILAGGLGPDNVAEAIRRVRPWGVDSFTRTCYEGDLRRKDPDRLSSFVAAVRSTADDPISPDGR